MKNQPARHATTERSREAGRIAVTQDLTDSWIEELTPPREVQIFPARHRRIGVTVILVLAFVAVGILGRVTERGAQVGALPPPDPPRAASNSATDAASSPAYLGLFEMMSPSEGQDVGGAVVHVTGVAGQDLGRLHFSVVLGDAVLGWTNVDVREPGFLETAIRVFAPSFHAVAELRVDGGGAGYGALSLSRSIALSPSGVVQLWRAETRLVGADCALAVDGVAPLTVTALSLHIVGRDGRAIADVNASNGMEISVAGSTGGRLVGMGSFHALIPNLDWSAAGDLRLTVSWADHAAGGSPGSLDIPISALANCDKIVQTRTYSIASFGVGRAPSS